MCSIFDNNVAGRIFSIHPDSDAATFIDWIDHEKGHLVLGGKLLEEILTHKNAKRWIRTRESAGKICLIPKSKIEKAEESVDINALKSNDIHIIALAIAGQARVLFTFDADLIEDFTNKDVIKNPRGKIYKREAHLRTVLRKAPC